MPVYEKASPEVREIVERLVTQYHGPLAEYGVTFDLLFAHAKTNENGDAEGPALKLHGYQAAAVARVVPYKARVLGQADAEIVIDGDRWDEWSEAEKDALIDHELEHFELKLNKDGNLVRDDLDRPKLHMRLHDHQFGWFDSIARRHGEASGEVQQFKAFCDSHKQLWLSFEPQAESGDNLSVSITAGGETVKTTVGGLSKAGRTARRAASSK